MNRRELLIALASLAAAKPLSATADLALEAPCKGFRLTAPQVGPESFDPSLGQLRDTILALDSDVLDPYVVLDGQERGFVQCLRVEGDYYVLEARLAPPDGDWTSGTFVRAELPAGRWAHPDHDNLVGADRVLAAFHDFAADPGRVPDLDGVVWRDIKEELWGEE